MAQRQKPAQQLQLQPSCVNPYIIERKVGSILTGKSKAVLPVTPTDTVAVALVKATVQTPYNLTKTSPTTLKRVKGSEVPPSFPLHLLYHPKSSRNAFFYFVRIQSVKRFSCSSRSIINLLYHFCKLQCQGDYAIAATRVYQK